jgi:nucleotide-binding universal stress UspA family protein
MLDSPILCAVDFSEASAGALRHAAALAEHFAARLIVLTVEDPLLTEAADLGLGITWTEEATKQELAQFVASIFGPSSALPTTCEFEVALGKPAPEILRVSAERGCALVVMSTQGLTGARKLFFGSTTERVLRETTIPVLLTPPQASGPVNVSDAKSVIRRILVPIDLSPTSTPHLAIARRVAETLDVPLIVAHVIEPVKTRLAARLQQAGLQADRRGVFEDKLKGLVAAGWAPPAPEALLAYGDPAEELAKIARDRDVGLIVMALHGSPQTGPRMGSVTYRLLCLIKTLVLAIPPGPA